MNEETSSSQISPTPASPEPKAGGPRKAIMGAVIALVAVGVIYKGYGSYEFGKTHVETDNAYVTGDLVGISPTVAGTVIELNVKDGSFVKKGQLIARLDASRYQAELAQAQANLKTAMTQVPQAESALAFEKLSTEAAIRRSQAAIATQTAKTEGSRLQVRLSDDTVKSDVDRAQSQLAEAQAQAAQAKSGIATADAQLVTARQAVVTAQANEEAQRATIAAVSADADKANQDFDRYKKLLETEAITRQEYDASVASAASAKANLENAKQRTQAAASQVAEARAGIEQARAAKFAATKQFEAAQKQVEVAAAGVRLAKSGHTNVQIQNSNVQTNEGQQTQADADLATAQAGAQQINLREKQIATSRAQVDQAKAAVAQAEVNVRDSNLYAPCDGYVVKHTVNVGTAINPGQTIATITRGDDVWIMANYKETQLESVREGQPVDIEIDAFPATKFHGKVLSIIHATGSATTLLPPDNSTGNFTKVVQRLPVKVSIDPVEGKPVRMGMSAVVTVDTGKGSE